MGRDGGYRALLLALTLAGCDRAPAKQTPTAATKGGPYAAEKPATPAAQVLVDEKLFRVVLSPLAPCKVATTCEAHLVVTALDGYKFNAEYPTKFAAKSSAAATVEGTGTVTILARTSARITVTFRAAGPGTTPITGALRLSVCTDDVCEIAAPAIAFDVPVTAA